MGRGAANVRAMSAIVITISPSRVHYTPLRRALPASTPTPRADRLHSVLLVAAGLVAFVDVEFGLAYVLHFAARLFG
jgi:hypothetical protein